MAYRSLLAVPARGEKLVDGAVVSMAEEVSLDLEDAIVPSEKAGSFTKDERELEYAGYRFHYALPRIAVAARLVVCMLWTAPSPTTAAR